MESKNDCIIADAESTFGEPERCVSTSKSVLILVNLGGMQRSGMRGFNRVQRGGGVAGGTIKDRLGFQTPARQKALAAVSGKRSTIKTRLGGVAAVTIGQVLDARQKINLNRVKKGRIGDARDKIEAKRRGKPGPGGIQTGNKFKNLTITATLGGPPQQQNAMPRGGYYPPQQQQQLQEPPRQAPRYTAGYPMESSGMFRSASMNVYNAPPPPANNSFGGHDDALFLTRTISNPAAVANNYSYGQQRSPLQSKPNMAYRTPAYSSRYAM